MLYSPPLAAIAYFTASLFDANIGDASAVLDTAALAILVAGIFVVARYKAALAASEATENAWRGERDAAVSRAERTAVELQAEVARRTVAEARPDLTKVELLLSQLVSVASAHEIAAAGRAAELKDSYRAVADEAVAIVVKAVKDGS